MSHDLVTAHMTAAALLAEAAGYATEAKTPAAAGHHNQALGTALPIEPLLRDALALYAAAAVLNRKRGRESVVLRIQQPKENDHDTAL